MQELGLNNNTTSQRKKLEQKYMIQFDLSWFQVANEKLEKEREI
jgi:hypothetical protein